MPTETVKRRLSNPISPSSDEHGLPPWQGRKSSGPVPPKVMSRRENELRTFLAACLEGEFPELGLLLATLLLDTSSAHTFLSHNRELFNPWQEALLSTRNGIYLHFLNKNNELLQNNNSI
jgi:hypothetical protein